MAKQHVRLPVKPLTDGTMAIVGTAGLAVFYYLAYKRNSKTGQCNPSIPRMAKALAIGQRTAIRALERLEQAGWIQVSRSQGERNTYALTADYDPLYKPPIPEVVRRKFGRRKRTD